MLITQRSAVDKSFKRYNENLTREVGLYGADTGHHQLNLIIGGWVPTKITTLAARSGFGKSAAIIPMLPTLGKVVNGRRAEMLIYSWEMSADTVADRSVCFETGLKTNELRYSRVLPEMLRQRVNKAYAKAQDFPVKYQQHTTNIDTVLKTNDLFIKEIQGKEAIEGVKIQPVIVIDYIGMIQADGKYGNRTYDLGNFMQKLKQYCNETGACVFNLAQINRTADVKEYPDVADLSDSQFIEQNSDTVIIGHRPEYYRKETMKDPEGGEIPSANKALWRVVKNREGEVKDYIVNCDISKFRFWHRDMEFGQDYTKLYQDEQFWKQQMGLR